MLATALVTIGLGILASTMVQLLRMMARTGRQAAREWRLAIRHERRAMEARVSAERLRGRIRHEADPFGYRELLSREADGRRDPPAPGRAGGARPR